MLDPGFLKKLEETEPNKIRQMSPEEIVRYEQYFAEQIPEFGLDSKHQNYKQQCQDRVFYLRSERQHREGYGIARRAWRWAVVGGVTGILILIAEYVPLIRDTFFSKAQPSSALQSPLETRPQSQSTTSVSPEPEADSSSAAPSPEPTATVEPSLLSPTP